MRDAVQWISGQCVMSVHSGGAARYESSFTNYPRSVELPLVYDMRASSALQQSGYNRNGVLVVRSRRPAGLLSVVACRVVKY